jgi:hypothetical protein
MQKYLIIVFSLILFCILPCSKCYAQNTPKFSDIDSAYQNAKKGILWSLSNIKAKKSRADNRLILNDNVVAEVKLTKEVNGVCIVSTGYAGSTEVSVTVYRSLTELVNEGYLEKNSPLLREDE